MVVRKNGEKGNNIETNANQNKNSVMADISARSQKEMSNIKEEKPKSTAINLSYWDNVINKIKQSGKMGIYVNLIGSMATEINDMIIEVKLANKNEFAKKILEAHENKLEIEKIASMEAGKTMSIRFISAEDKKKTGTRANNVENMINGLDIPINIIDE